MDNPYNPYNYNLYRQFFGRKKEIQYIESLLNSQDTPHISIVGESKIGKSSLIFKILQNYNCVQGIISVYLDCDEIDFENSFFQVLNLRLPENAQGIRDYSSFSNFVKKTKAKIIIFLNNFERLSAYDRSSLRSLADNHREELTCILEVLTHKSVQAFGFRSIFKSVTIGLLDDTSIDELRRYGFEKNNIFLEEDEKKMIEYYAGAFPFFNQVVCRYILNSRIDETEPDRDELEVNLRPYYEELWESRTKQEQELLRHINDAEDSMSLKEMKTRGLLTENNDGYHLFSEFFPEFLRMYEKDDSL